MSESSQCLDLVELRTGELSKQINDMYHNLDNRMTELDTKNVNNRTDMMVREISPSNSGKLRSLLLLNMIICILVLIILIKSFMS